MKEDPYASLRRVERNYHIFKAFLITIFAIITLLFMTYLADKSVNSVNEKNERVEKLLRCSLPAFTPQNYPKAQIIIEKCLKDTKE